MDKLTPQLNEVQLKQNIDALQKGGMQNDKVQAYVNNYTRGTGGNYVLKTPQSIPQQSPNPSYMDRVSQSQLEGGNAMVEGYKQVQDATQPANSFGGVMKNAGNQLLGAGHMAAGAINGLSAPFSAAISPIFSGIEQNAEQGKGLVGQLINSATNNPKVQKVLSDPSVQEAIPDLMTLILTLYGGEKAPEAKTAIENAGTTSAEGIKTGVTDLAQGAKNTASALKEKLAPTPTIDQLVGRVAQGGVEDKPSFTRGIQNLDTSKIGTYSDLENASKKSIASDAKAQDVNLGKEEAPVSKSQLEQTTGEGQNAVKTNYVQQAIDQLKSFYEKTNNSKGLSQIKALDTKLNGVFDANGKVVEEPTGLTVKEINNLARTHGIDLNGFNANGELASGLTKQAAENTRTGLKNTIESSIKDPVVRENFRALDKRMSDTYTVKDLSNKMAEKVNALTQRLQKPNILQKVGAFLGKATRITGVGDFASKLLGIDKVPGAQTLNAVELEARLAKNLAKITNALGKDDAGFVKDITDVANSLQSEEAPTRPQKSQVKESSPNDTTQSNFSKGETPKTIPNKKGGFVKNPFSSDEIPSKNPESLKENIRHAKEEMLPKAQGLEQKQRILDYIKNQEEQMNISEAKKYKSAEEYVKAQPKAYHFTSPETKITKWSTKKSMGRIWFTDNPNVGENVGATGKGKMYEVNIDKNAKWATPDQANKSFTDQLISEGYDGVYHPDSSGKYGNYYEVFNPKVIQTKSQLTDIWKKANKK